MQQLNANLRKSDQFMIAARSGESSGVFRIPDGGAQARNCCLIAEATGRDEQPIARPVVSAEDGSARTVAKWDLRVDQKTYNSVAFCFPPRRKP